MKESENPNVFKIKYEVNWDTFTAIVIASSKPKACRLIGKEGRVLSIRKITGKKSRMLITRANL